MGGGGGGGGAVSTAGLQGLRPHLLRPFPGGPLLRPSPQDDLLEEEKEREGLLGLAVSASRNLCTYHSCAKRFPHIILYKQTPRDSCEKLLKKSSHSCVKRSKKTHAFLREVLEEDLFSFLREALEKALSFLREALEEDLFSFLREALEKTLAFLREALLPPNFPTYIILLSNSVSFTCCLK